MGILHRDVWHLIDRSPLGAPLYISTSLVLALGDPCQVKPANVLLSRRGWKLSEAHPDFLFPAGTDQKPNPFKGSCGEAADM